ncbi:MAG: toprim domain-containing protein, partial [Selenomonadaceae bacterium]|nr:toprim domain-containing protein [Selenomonadaceae bacterium]
MNVFDLINDWSPDELLRHIDLPLANDGKSYVCPVCDNGRGGGKGDGIKPRTNSKGQTRWKCFKCGKDFSNFDLASASLGYSEYDTAETAKSLRERLGLIEEAATFSFSRESGFTHFSAAERQASRSAPPSKSQTAPASTSEPKDYTKLYEYCRGNVAKFLSENGGSYRGLMGATFEKYGLGVHPAFGLEGEKKVPALIIPYDEKHFVARKLKDVEGNQKVTQHGTGAGLYEAVKISQDSPNFIFEGELDALSAAQVIGSLGIGCIATGGASKWRKVITELEKRYGAKEDKPSFIVAYDNDEAGKRNGLELAIGLRGLGYATELFFFE